jgi:hypothetical protein
MKVHVRIVKPRLDRHAARMEYCSLLFHGESGFASLRP